MERRSMRLTSITAREMFSFGTLDLGDLPTRALVVVGPNGSGKTNLSRLVEIIFAVMERSATSSQEAYAALVRFGAARRFDAAPANVSSVRLGIALTEEWESELLLRYVRAALMASILSGAPSNIETSGLLAWVKEINAEMLTPLIRGEIVAELVDASTGQWTLAYEFDVDGERFRWVLDGAHMSTGAIVRIADANQTTPNHMIGQKLNVDQRYVPQKPFTFSDLLPPVGEARMVLVDSGPLPAKEPMREWASLAGIPLEATQGRSYTMVWVLRVLLERGLIMLGDLRQPPMVEYAVTEASFDPSPADGSRVPLRLFRLKNGDPAQRARFAASQELFTRLTGLTFDITLATRSANQLGEAPLNLLISPVVIRHGRDLPVEFAGAGVWEALLLSATLSDSAGRVALLDEPARNLHPTLQRRLLSEMHGAPGQFIVTTHSPYLVSIGDDADVTSIVRLDLRDGATHASRLAQGGSVDDARLRKVLGESADARALLFARGVVLVEGGTELGALPEWFGKSAMAQKLGTPDALNMDIFSVDGDLGYGTFVRFLHGLGVPWAIVCDGAIFRFGSGKQQIFEQVLNAGVTADELRAIVDSSATVSPTFTDMRDVGARHGVFTVATDWVSPAESFEAYVQGVAPGQLDAAEKIVGKSKPRKGRHIATTIDCPEEIDALYARLLDRLGINDSGE
jgi:energy-coupling factor transporter ATP-binding protein EcfA2